MHSPSETQISRSGQGSFTLGRRAYRLRINHRTNGILQVRDPFGIHLNWSLHIPHWITIAIPNNQNGSHVTDLTREHDISAVPNQRRSHNGNHCSDFELEPATFDKLFRADLYFHGSV